MPKTRAIAQAARAGARQTLQSPGTGSPPPGQNPKEPAPVTRLAPIIALAALLLPMALRAEEVPRTVTVSGQGSVTAIPDIATVTLGVSTAADDAAAALAANSARMAQVLDLLRAEGIAERDVETSQFGLDPVWEESEEDAPARIAGYRVRNLVTVRLRDVSALGRLLDRLTAAGANDIAGIGFALSDSSALLAEARRRAVADAVATATLYAEAAGARLGRVLTLADQGTSLPMPAPRYRAEAMAAVPVAPGEATVTASVMVVFALE